MINRKIYCFWFGPKMSFDRRKCFKSIVKNSGVDVELITEENISNYIVKSDLLYKGFKLLSSTHKSAYLRPYFMKHHGGCYMDIKYLREDFNQYFDLLENSNKDFIGYQEHSSQYGVWTKDWSLKEKERLAGACRYIFKPNTKFANLWYDKIIGYLNSIYPQLIDNPGTYHQRAIPGGFGGGGGEKKVIDYDKYGHYPISWSRIFGRYLQETMYENPKLYMFGLPYTFRIDPDWVPYR